jgi:hypothetical protein
MIGYTERMMECSDKLKGRKLAIPLLKQRIGERVNTIEQIVITLLGEEVITPQNEHAISIGLGVMDMYDPNGERLSEQGIYNGEELSPQGRYNNGDQPKTYQ